MGAIWCELTVFDSVFTDFVRISNDHATDVYSSSTQAYLHVALRNRIMPLKRFVKYHYNPFIFNNNNSCSFVRLQTMFYH